MKTFDLGYFKNERNVERLREILNDQTYMNFIINYGISPGGPHVTLSTDYEASDEDILTFALHVVSNS